jgi:2-iminobutanoate/2-iminopropanoate deaminase
MDSAMSNMIATLTRSHSTRLFSDAVECSGLIFLRGVTANDRSQGLSGQTSQVLEQIETMLADRGTNKSAIVSATIYMVDIAQRDEMNNVWATWIDPANLPARATVGVKALGTPETLIEIVVTAAQGQRETETMSQQGTAAHGS